MKLYTTSTNQRQNPVTTSFCRGAVANAIVSGDYSLIDTVYCLLFIQQAWTSFNEVLTTRQEV